MTDKAYVSGTVAPTVDSAAPGQRYNQSSAAPTRKTVYGAIGAAATGTVGGAAALKFAWQVIMVPRGYPEMDLEAALGIAAMFGAIAAGGSYVFAYFKRERAPK
jgi:hypothetical protein